MVEEDLFIASGQSRPQARGARYCVLHVVVATGRSRCLGSALAGLILNILFK